LTDPPSDGKWPHIWWIPTGLLTKFPLHAAGRHKENSSETVIDRVMSSYSSSIKTMLHSRSSRSLEIPPSASRQALLIAVPNAPGSLPLRFATKEVATLHKLCKSMAFDPIEPGRRKSDIISRLPQCKIFHFAGHGFTDGNDPSGSYLLLEDGKNDPLTVAILLEMNIREQSPFLAYLSACGTGQISDERFLDESIHLISAFQLAGFRHVIGTLWEVNDEVCVDVASITYEGMRDGRMTDESVCLGLHNAIRKLRNDWVFAKGSRRGLNNQSGARDAGYGDQRDDRLPRDGVICEDDEEGSLSWVPYIHFGV
jgi:CHAT domain-containing protein